MNAKPKIWPVGTKLIEMAEVSAMTGLSQIEISHKMKLHGFPQSIRVKGEREGVICHHKWALPEIEAWLAKQHTTPAPIPAWVTGFISIADRMHNTNRESHIDSCRDRLFGCCFALDWSGVITQDQCSHLLQVVDVAYSQSLARIGAI